MIQFTCPECGMDLRTERGELRRRMMCYHCQEIVLVPGNRRGPRDERPFTEPDCDQQAAGFFMWIS